MSIAGILTVVLSLRLLISQDHRYRKISGHSAHFGKRDKTSAKYIKHFEQFEMQSSNIAKHALSSEQLCCPTREIPNNRLWRWGQGGGGGESCKKEMRIEGVTRIFS